MRDDDFKWDGPSIKEYSEAEIDYLKGHYFLLGCLITTGIFFVLWWAF